MVDFIIATFVVLGSFIISAVSFVTGYKTAKKEFDITRDAFRSAQVDEYLQGYNDAINESYSNPKKPPQKLQGL